MSPFALGGFAMALLGLIYVIIAAGSSPAALWDPSSFVLVFFGTVGITMLSIPSADLMAAMKILPRGFGGKEAKYEEVIALFVELAEQARREGLLSLEERIGRIDNPFIKKGMQLLVDGTDPSAIREMMELDISQLESRHARRYGVLETMGAYAPTMGMLGTVTGIIFTLANLTTPDQIGAQVSLAFITTLYGALFSNFLFLPLGGRLKRVSKIEVSEQEMALEGMMSVQAGDNPQIVRQKLEAFLPVGVRDALAVREA